MNARSTAFLGALAVGAAAPLAGAAAALAILVPIVPAPPALPPGAGYAWAQPSSAAVAVPCAQPPASIPIATVLPALPGTAYTWAHPGSALQAVPFAQPPASVAIATDVQGSCSTGVNPGPAA